jgi:hypothetical protein
MSAGRAKAFIKTRVCQSSEDVSRDPSPGVLSNKGAELALITLQLASLVQPKTFFPSSP